MYGHKILLFTSLVLPIFAVPLQGSTILQENAVVERSHDPVGDAILPSLPKREPVIDLVEREKRPGGGGFGPQNRSIEEVEKRKNRFNGVGFGDPRRRSDSFETSMEDDEDEARPKIGGNKRGLQRPDNGGGG